MPNTHTADPSACERKQVIRFARQHLIAVFATLWLMAPMAGYAAATKQATLDTLMGQRLPSDSTAVVIMEPAEHQFTAIIDALPKEGKTTYMTEALASRRIKTRSPVTHKMWLRTSSGERAMVYVPQHLSRSMTASLKVGNTVEISALQLWNSRHGPGLLLRAINPVATAKQ